MENTIDLDLKNYTFEDLLNLFGITTKLNDSEFSRCNQVLFTLKENINNDEIIKFYQTSNFILLCLKQYRNIVKKKNIDYEIYNDEYIVNQLINDPKIFSWNNPTKYIAKLIETENLEKDDNDKMIKALKTCLQEIKKERVVTVYQDPVAKGDINRLKRVTQIQNVHFNSCFRENYYNTNPTNFNYTIPNGGILNVVSMKLLSIEIPNCWFLFSGLIGNNKFRVEVTVCEKKCGGKKCSVHDIIIPDGNYNRETLVTFLNEKYFVKSKHEILKNIEFAINPYTNRSYFKLADCAPEEFVFSLHFVVDGNDNILQTFGWIIGFRLARYLKIDDVIQSEGLFDAAGDRYVYFSLNDYLLNYNETNIVCFDGMSINEHILAKIPMVDGKFSLVLNENNSSALVKTRQYNGPVNIKRMEIKLLDRFGNIVDFNNMDWSFSIEFEILYENII